MFTGVQVDGPWILFVKAEEPFSLDDDVAFTTAVANGAHPGVALDMLAVLDMRGATSCASLPRISPATSCAAAP
jgi:hypothetical protein